MCIRDSFFILAQNLVILTLMGVYGGKGKKGGGVAELLPAALAYLVLTVVLGSGLLPQQYLEMGYNATTAMLIYGEELEVHAFIRTVPLALF